MWVSATPPRASRAGSSACPELVFVINVSIKGDLMRTETIRGMSFGYGSGLVRVMRVKAPLVIGARAIPWFPGGIRVAVVKVQVAVFSARKRFECL